MKPNWLIDLNEIEHLDVAWVASCLSRINRYGGQRPCSINVAGHSVMVEQCLPEDAPLRLRFHALAHDIHEIWTGDILRPVCERLGDAIEQIKSELDDQIFELLHIPVLPGDKEIVLAADRKAAEVEMLNLIIYDTGYVDWLKRWRELERCQEN